MSYFINLIGLLNSSLFTNILWPAWTFSRQPKFPSLSAGTNPKLSVSPVDFCPVHGAQARALPRVSRSPSVHGLPGRHCTGLRCCGYDNSPVFPIPCSCFRKYPGCSSLRAQLISQTPLLRDGTNLAPRGQVRRAGLWAELQRALVVTLVCENRA